MTDIAQFMSQDHERLDAIFADFHNEPDGGRAKKLFSRFESGLRAHIGWEEDMLFPPFEERTGMRDSGPTVVMRVEHQQIKELLQSIREGIEGRTRQISMYVPETGRQQTVTVKEKADRRTVKASAKRLVDVLLAHNDKEERMLYAWVNRTLEEGERSAFLKRMQSPSPGTPEDQQGS